jgi:4-alpha-glucanotransferase
MSGPSTPTDRLFAVARSLDIETGYWDVRGQHHDASLDSVVAVLGALGLPIDADDVIADRAVAELADHDLARRTEVLPPTVALFDDPAPSTVLCLPADDEPAVLRVVVALEDGSAHLDDVRLDDLEVIGEVEADGRRWIRRRLRFGVGPASAGSGALPIGYHQLRVEHGGRTSSANVLAAPRVVHQLAPSDRLWGVFAPLYSLRGAGPLGPSVSDLDRLGRWIDREGGKIVGTLPLLASFLDRPCEPSPYSPVSRRFWNELYLDIDRLWPEDALEDSRAWLEQPDVQDDLAALDAAPRFDACGRAAVLVQLLQQLAPRFFSPSTRVPGFDRWVAEHPLATDYARFRAVAERQGRGWRQWPERLQEGRVGSDDYDVRVAARHVYAQWAMDRQLGEVAEGLASRQQLLYLDLPVGAAGDGFDTWIDRGSYAWGTTVGAPPDEFFAGGQNWGFPAVRPAAARAEGHRQLAECVRHHMTRAGLLRIDHVMGLHRLYLVPEGSDATDGVYVRYPEDEQYAVIAIESVRAGCAVVGEDLGTVPPEVREAMSRHGVLRSFVAEFCAPTPWAEHLDGPDHRMVATVGTHDTPTFAGFVSGHDVRGRAAAGRLEPAAAAAAETHRHDVVARLAELLDVPPWAIELPAAEEHASGAPSPLLAAVLRWLGGSDAPALLVALDDLVGALEPQNIPGTGRERANWTRRLDRSVDELADDPVIVSVLEQVQAARLWSYDRATAPAVEAR